MKKHLYSVVSLVLLTGSGLSPHTAHAKDPENPFRRSAAIAARNGGVHGGGGDLVTESRIQEIRADLVKWIAQGGAKAIDFSKSRAKITYDVYVNGDEKNGIYGMNDLLADGAVVVNSISDGEEQMNDEEMNTYVDGFPKTCKGFISRKDQRPHILCNISRFWDLKPGWSKEQLEAEQYRQVHHEYAALGKLEKNVESDSDTSISDQITTFLKPESVLRLAVKKAPIDPTVAKGLRIVFENAYNHDNGLPRMVQKFKKSLMRQGAVLVKDAAKANFGVRIEVTDGYEDEVKVAPGPFKRADTYEVRTTTLWIEVYQNGSLIYQAGYRFREDELDADAADLLGHMGKK